MKKAPNPITVLVADDHPVVREGIAAMVHQQPDMIVVAEAANGRDAIELWRQHRPAVALLDLQLGDMCGVEVLLEIRKYDPGARALILSTYDLEEDIYRSVQAGARGYLLKDVPRLDLLDAIRKVHRGEKVLAATVASKLADRLTSDSPSPRELEVLECVALGKANKEIAETLAISEGTVKAHIKAIFAKLGVLSRTEAVDVARRRGFLKRW
jgi:DNA-binding NarL/FixJ family response regulator